MNNYIPQFDRVVDRFMSAYGFTCYIVRQQKGTYDPTSSEYVMQETSIPCTGIIFDYTLRQLGDRNTPNSLIQAGDKQLFVRPLQKEQVLDRSDIEKLLTSADSIEINNERWKVITFKEINPSNNNSYVWELQIRK